MSALKGANQKFPAGRVVVGHVAHALLKRRGIADKWLDSRHMRVWRR